MLQGGHGEVGLEASGQGLGNRWMLGADVGMSLGAGMAVNIDICILLVSFLNLGALGLDRRVGHQLFAAELLVVLLVVIIGSGLPLSSSALALTVTALIAATTGYAALAGALVVAGHVGALAVDAGTTNALSLLQGALALALA